MTCQYCKKESQRVVELHGWKLCENCRGLLKKAKKKQKREKELTSYHDALVKPELRGLKGSRK